MKRYLLLILSIITLSGCTIVSKDNQIGPASIEKNHREVIHSMNDVVMLYDFLSHDKQYKYLNISIEEYQKGERTDILTGFSYNVTDTEVNDPGVLAVTMDDFEEDPENINISVVTAQKHGGATFNSSHSLPLESFEYGFKSTIEEIVTFEKDTEYIIGVIMLDKNKVSLPNLTPEIHTNEDGVPVIIRNSNDNSVHYIVKAQFTKHPINFEHVK